VSGHIFAINPFVNRESFDPQVLGDFLDGIPTISARISHFSLSSKTQDPDYKSRF
jgi:hypothetical protein